ncbi:MAG: TRAM domain-containing protein [Vicinamibacterales bacterium]|nr:TRAM domain-containing protein [Vicinamibacterales bacterium]
MTNIRHTTPSPPSGTVLDVTVERPVVGGRMLARHEGRVVLVAGAIPGEHVRVVVEHAKRDVLLAQTVEVLEASRDRRPVMGLAGCGGRAFAHVAYRRQLQLKTDIIRDAFRRTGRLDLDESPPMVASPERGYRMRARLHVDAQRVGFLEEGSHRVCDVAGSGQLLPKTERLVERLGSVAAVLSEAGVKALELAEDLPGGQCVLHLPRCEDRGGMADTWRALAELPGVTGLTSAGDVGAVGPRILAGAPRLTDPLGSFLPSDGAGVLTLGRHAHAFFQANRYVVRELVTAVADLAGGPEVVDLYAGVGLFAVCIAARQGGHVTAVERDSSSVPDLRANAAPLAPAVEVVRAPVETYLKRTPRLSGSTVIVDPPRAGLSREVLTRLARARPDRIVYVSCDVATQARDLRAFGPLGYRVALVRAFDMFPNTPHLETLVSLERR